MFFFSCCRTSRLTGSRIYRRSGGAACWAFSYSLSGLSWFSFLLAAGFRSRIMSCKYGQYSVASKPTPCMLRRTNDAVLSTLCFRRSSRNTGDPRWHILRISPKYASPSRHPAPPRAMSFPENTNTSVMAETGAHLYKSNTSPGVARLDSAHSMRSCLSRYSC